MNTHQLILGGFMVIRAAMIAFDVLLLILVAAVGTALLTRLRHAGPSR